MAESKKMPLSMCGPVGMRIFELAEICQESTPHKHNFDHCTIIMSGAVAVLVDGVEVGRVSATDHRPYIEVAAESLHTIKALEANTRYACIFSHRDTDGVVVQTYSGNDRAYK